MQAQIECVPVTAKHWADLAHLFGPEGGYGGCWCMYWRMERPEWERNCGEPNKRLFQSLFQAGQIHGILAYDGDRPVGWLSVAPRHEFVSLIEEYRRFDADEEPVWAIACFYVEPAYRGQGLSKTLLHAAIEYVQEQGGRILEGYPTWPQKKVADVDAYMGAGHTFLEAGFQEVDQVNKGETSVMRRYL